MNRVFLDANVLFSAAYRPDSALNDLWALSDTELVTSYLAAEEARRNLDTHKPDAIPQLEKLLDAVELCAKPKNTPRVAEEVQLAEKDVPILVAAIHSKSTHLITGDNQHFGHLFGRVVSGVKVMTPGQYLRARKERSL